MNIARIALAVAAACLFATTYAGCSVDAKRNRSYGCADCSKRGGVCVKNFCVIADGGSAKPDAGHGHKDASQTGSLDAAHADASLDGAALDASHDAAVKKDAAVDSGPGEDGGGAEPCTKEGKVEFCYDGSPMATANVAPCRTGQRTCHKGFWGACLGEVTPSTDVCDNLDNDCDTKVDEGLSNLGSCPVSGQEASTLCAMGTFECHDGAFVCKQLVFSVTETCNTKDDDCDTKVDEDLAQDCYTYVPPGGSPAGCTPDGKGSFTCVGTCNFGTNKCNSGTMDNSCPGQVPPVSEANTTVGQQAKDEDCDGKIDEGFSCTNGQSYVCYTGSVSPIDTSTHLPCKKGTQLCTGGMLQPCTGEVMPSTEDCNNMNTDDDCNGTKDDVATLGDPCPATTSVNGVTCAGSYQCTGGATPVCAQPPSPPSEICNGEDDDCDGMIDNGFDFNNDTNNCGQCGKKCASSLKCCGGTCVDTAKSASNCGMCAKSCGTGGGCCGMTCKNLQTDVNNCGTCGTKCPATGLLGLTAPKCSGGHCQ